MKPVVIREICGTSRGYRRHKNNKEEKCAECRAAYNVDRRTKYYNPEKQKVYKEKYDEKTVKPARLARKKAQEEARAKKKAEALARKEEKRQRGILYKAEKERRRIAYAKKLADSAKRKEEERKAIEERKNEAIRLREEKLEKKLQEKARKAQALKDAQEAKRAEKARIAAERKARQEAFDKQHGTSIADYSRCKKKNKEACSPCRAAAAQYRRAQVAKDPEKFKEQDRKYRKEHGNVTSRDRAKKNGGKYAYYTRKQIFDRDGYDCYLCKTPIDLNAPHIQGEPGWETYPHVEHVIPLALGGDDTLENVKIAHAKCNMDKGTRLLS
jgi:IgA-specific serine endopeptidase